MKRSNTKLLTKEDLEIVNSKYEITYSDNVLLVRSLNIDRVICHKLDKDFTISLNINDKKRYIKIDSITSKIYVKNYLHSKYSLFDIQNAINSLIISYQDIKVEDINKQLKLLNY